VEKLHQDPPPPLGMAMCCGHLRGCELTAYSHLRPGSPDYPVRHCRLSLSNVPAHRAKVDHLQHTTTARRDAMSDLQINRWEDFQEIGCYWMKALAQQRQGCYMPYSVYGGVGQKQCGVDLVPNHIAFGIVGQSKLRNVRSLTWAEIEKELVMTNEYPGPIREYFVLTTAGRHTSVQDKMPFGGATYTRRQGSFQVFVCYWSELKTRDFIPQDVLLRIFPSMASLATGLASRQPRPNEYMDSLLFARSFLPQLISLSHIEWLESWDFGLGYVRTDDFDHFAELRIDLDRVLQVKAQPRLQEWLSEGRRAEMFKCLPAAENLFRRVLEFTHAVVSEASTATRSGITVLAHGHSDPSRLLKYSPPSFPG